MNKRTLITFALVMGTMFLYMNFVLPMMEPQEIPKDQSVIDAKEKASSVSHESDTVNKTDPAKTISSLQGETPKVVSESVPLIDDIILENDLIKVVFSNKGAVITSIRLKQYAKSLKSEERYEIFHKDNTGAMSMDLIDDEDQHLSSDHWIVKSHSSNSVSFSYTNPFGIEVTKHFTLQDDSYNFTTRVELTQHRNKEDQEIAFYISLFPSLEHDSAYRQDGYLTGVVGQLETEWAVSTVAYTDEDVLLGRHYEKVLGKRCWAGIKNRYFTAIASPTSVDYIEQFLFRKPSESYEKRTGNATNIGCGFHSTSIRLTQGKPIDFTWDMYIGPMQEKILIAQGKGMDQLLDYTGFNFIGNFILWVLNVFYHLFGNYGMGIIATTLMMHACMFPLIKKSQISMFKMQELAPKMKELKEKFKNDKQKVGVEQMKMYKEHGVSPLSGCLPMIIQMPIFIGMYSVLDLAIDLRQSPFTLWISDLSQPDRLAHLPFSFMGVEYLNLLPIIMMITWTTQSLLTPKSPDPQAAQQQKMMMFMPLIFGIFCYTLASGLSLYFFFNSLVGIIEQRVIRKVYGLTPTTTDTDQN